MISTYNYIANLIEKEPEYLQTIWRRTNVKLINPRMQSGHYQGRLLKMITNIINPQEVLEVGTFSAYSTLCIAEGLTSTGHIDTIEIDDELEDFIRENISLSPDKNKITLHIGDALKIIPTIGKKFDLAFIDGNKRCYIEYFETILQKLNPKGLIIADNTLWNGKVMTTPNANDYQTKAIIKFNNHVAQNRYVEQIILPIRDGLTLIRKK